MVKNNKIISTIKLQLFSGFHKTGPKLHLTKELELLSIKDNSAIKRYKISTQTDHMLALPAADVHILRTVVGVSV